MKNVEVCRLHIFVKIPGELPGSGAICAEKPSFDPS